MISNADLTIAELIAQATKHLQASGIETPSLDARILFEAASGFSRAEIISKSKDDVSTQTRYRFLSFIEERKAGKPVYRIIGRRDFYGREFKVFDDVLDPRPETELLVDLIVSEWKGHLCRFAEIGVGSGAISVSLLAEMEQAQGLATDICDHAINAATFNAEQIGVANRLEIRKANCLIDADGPITGQFDFIVSNPPYIDSNEMAGLSKEVLSHDPKIALDGGKAGLEFYGRIFDEARHIIIPDGKLYLETGYGQHADLIEMAGKIGWGLISSHLDLSGLERIVVFKYEGEDSFG